MIVSEICDASKHNTLKTCSEYLTNKQLSDYLQNKKLLMI